MKQSYYDKQTESLKLIPASENYVKMQISSANGKTNWMNITERQLRQIIEILNSKQ